MDIEDKTLLELAARVATRANFDLGAIQTTEACGLDALFQREASIITPQKTGRTKVASLSTLNGFVRLSSEMLVHKSDRDLWSLKKEADGSYFIERLFDDDGNPLKG